MKRLIAIGLFVYAFLLTVLIGLLCRERIEVVQAAGGRGLPVKNGDVNGDGSIDISDAVYTLIWLFTGGSGPVAIECPLPVNRGLPATGQTKCYDWGGSEIACDNPDFPGQDGFYQAGVPSESRFMDNGDGTVTDNCTGLMWQKDTADVGLVFWQEALKYCDGLEFADHTDWRLPNVRELQSIVDYRRLNPPTIDPVFEAVWLSYWSSSSYEAYPNLGKWCVDFFNGSTGNIGGPDQKQVSRRALPDAFPGGADQLP